MPYNAPFEQGDLDYLKRRAPKSAEKVEAALKEGKIPVWEKSSFSDPGADWSNLLVDGVSVYYESGY